MRPGNLLIIWYLLFFLIIPGRVCAQISFEVPDTVCMHDSVTINNTSMDAESYYWNFCSGNLVYNPGGVNFPDPATLNGPAFIDFALDESDYYAFITNHTDGTITRYFYGYDFLSIPVAENLGSFGGIIPDHVQGVQVVEDDGQWYVFVVGGQREDSRLVRLDFGNSLSNTPVAVNLGNAGAMDYPIDLYIFQENGQWYGFTASYNLNRVTQFYFGVDLSTNPISITFGEGLGLNHPCGLFPIKVEGNWYLFVSNYGSNEIISLDFGSSLNNMPVGESIGNPEYLYYPFDLTILRDCGRTFGFVLNRLGDIVRMEFNNGIDSIPGFTSLGEVGNLYNPQGISDVFRVGDTLYAFVANIDNSSITRLYFPGCNNASVASSTDRNPPSITYSTPGNYNISLVINEGLPDQENYCRNVTVLESPEVNLGNDTVIATGTIITLDAGGDSSTYSWSTGETTRSIEVDMPGRYSVIVTNEYGCTLEDEILITSDIDIPNFFTPNNDGYNDTWEIQFLWNAPDALIQVFDRFGNLMTSYKSGDGTWDGTKDGEPVPDDTYWYVIKINNETDPLKGSVTIKR
jgi:gliding motility-associated-like protein